MSKTIKNDHPFTEKEIRYLTSRGRVTEIERNRKKFGSESNKVQSKEKESPEATKSQGTQADSQPHKSDSRKTKLDQDIYEQVRSFGPADLEKQLRGYGLGVPETERGQRIKLANYLQKQRDS